MSFFSKLTRRKGGKKQEIEDPSAGQAIQQVREIQDSLEKKQLFLEKKIADELEIAKQNSHSNRRLALQALQRKKRYEKQLQQIDGTLATLDSQTAALDATNINVSVVNTMKIASNALKASHSKINVDDVHDIMDDLGEQQDITSEITNAISNPIAFSRDRDIDEDDLMRELEEINDKFLSVPNGNETVAIVVEPNVVSTPQVTPRKSKTNVDDLKKLEQWAS